MVAIMIMTMIVLIVMSVDVCLSAGKHQFTTVHIQRGLCVQHRE
jgi:hypothetical protein